MINLLILFVVIIVLLFGFVLFFGAPYLPTLRQQSTEALDLLDLQAGQTLLELGSGDGRVLREAAKRGIYGIGYEINPLLVVVSWVLLYRYRKFSRVKFGNYWHQKLPPADGIYVFLLDPFMTKLHNKITQEMKGYVKVVSYAFAIPEIKPVTTQGALMLYEYGTSKKGHTKAQAGVVDESLPEHSVHYVAKITAKPGRRAAEPARQTRKAAARNRGVRAGAQRRPGMVS